MRTPTSLLLLISCLTGLDARAQAGCPDIVIEQIRYSAVNSAVIEISAYAITGDCVEYPSFFLFDQNGDTLARESVGFFCLGLGSALPHSLNVVPGAVIPTGPFAGRLDLYTGFEDALVCSWDLSAIDLCPPSECQQAEIYLTNTGDLVAFSAYWWVLDDDGMQVDFGTFEVDDVIHTHFDTTCLLPGNYELGFSPFSPINETYIIGITHSYQQSIGTNTVLAGSTSPLDLSFAWYEACIDGTNAITERSVADILIRQDADHLLIADPDGNKLGNIALYTSDGRLARSLHDNRDRVSMEISGLSPGLHIVRVIRPNGITFSRSIIIL